MAEVFVEQLNPVRGHTVSGAVALVEKAAAVDGAVAISEQALLELRHSPQDVLSYAVIGPDHSFHAFALVVGTTAELVVDPDVRGRGIGSALLGRVLDLPGPVRLWAHASHPAAIALAHSNALRPVRRLHQMHRSLAELPVLPVPAGVSVRAFRTGADEQLWLDLNARAFAAHPEQGHWTMADLLAREQEPWFDPSGFLIAERAGEAIGFHWTKVHVPGSLGEVYVIGVDPSAQGSGLGGALTIAGLEHLRSQGISEAILFVDEVNTSAIRVYERLGFTVAHTDVCFAR